MKKDFNSRFTYTGNIHLSNHIDMKHTDKQGGGEVQPEITKPIAPDTLIMIREALADGIAKTLVYSVIQSLHIEDEKLNKVC